MWWMWLVIWAVGGISGSWWWWSRDLDLTLGSAIGLFFMGGITGPIWWAIVGFGALGRVIRRHHKKRGPIIVLRARHDLFEDRRKEEIE